MNDTKRLKRRIKHTRLTTKKLEEKSKLIRENGLKGLGFRGQRQTREQRQVLALEMRLTGMSYTEIAKRLGISDAQAWWDVKKELDREKARSERKAPKVRKLELERLDRLLEKLWPLATTGIPVLDAKGNPIKDKDGNVLTRIDKQAVDRVIKIMERRAAFLGVDEPKKIQRYEDPEGRKLDVNLGADQALLELFKRYLPSDKEEKE